MRTREGERKGWGVVFFYMCLGSPPPPLHSGSCNRGDGNQGSNLAGNYLVGNGNNPCPF